MVVDPVHAADRAGITRSLLDHDYCGDDQFFVDGLREKGGLSWLGDTASFFLLPNFVRRWIQQSALMSMQRRGNASVNSNVMNTHVPSFISKRRE
jgi:hypothetical protein